MKNLFNTFFLLLFLSSISSAQYEIKCAQLQNPDLMKTHIDSCARFWFNSYDQINGGFYEDVARNGDATSTNKTMLGQSRTSYAMARAFMMTGDTTFLQYARGALDFMYAHAWDKVNKGWFNEMNEDGSLRNDGDHNNDKWSFMQHYALLGITAMVDATQSTVDWQYLLAGRKSVDDHLWDNRIGYEGYYDTANKDWSNPRDKGFTPTMDGITTHILSLYLLTNNDEYKQRLIALADNVVDHIWPAMAEFNYGYPESYNSDWVPNLNNTFIFTGHFLKSAWCLTRAYLIEPKPEYIQFSTEILDEVLAKGYDNINGGNYSTGNGKTGVLNNQNKVWWELEQGFNSSIMNYYITNEEKYLKMADETLNFYMTYVVDHQYGEVFDTVTKTGVVAGSDRKAHYWKAGYHSSEIAYYTYLYGNLYLHNRPVSLYYKYNIENEDRHIKLYPCAIEDDKLIIQNVTLDNSNYANFDSKSRTLNIPAGVAGIFNVTYKTTLTTGITINEIPNSFTLMQNYPNPFNPETTIQYFLNSAGFVSMDIFNIQGQKIKTLVSEYKTPGKYYVTWNAKTENGNKASSGVYFYQLKFGDKKEIKKAILLF